MQENNLYFTNFLNVLLMDYRFFSNIQEFKKYLNKKVTLKTYVNQSNLFERNFNLFDNLMKKKQFVKMFTYGEKANKKVGVIFLKCGQKFLFCFILFIQY